MMNTNTGGPAFPSTFHNGWGEPEKGMPLRDYFAAKAMQAWLPICWDEHGIEDVYEKEVAKFAYSMADAMLKEREE